MYHGPTVYTNYYNGCILAKTLGIKKVFFLNFDYIINDGPYLNEISSILIHTKKNNRKINSL